MGIVVCGVAGSAAAKPPAEFAAPGAADAAALDAVLGKAAADWRMLVRRGKQAAAPALAAPDDAALGRRVLVTSAATTLRLETPFDRGGFRCRLRFDPVEVGPARRFKLRVGVDPARPEAKPAEVALQPAAKAPVVTVACGDRKFPYRLRAYETILPTWPEEVRLPIEAAMAELPGPFERWFDLRCVADAAGLACWLDDRYLGRLPAGAGRLVEIECSAGVRIDRLRIEPPPVPTAAEWLPLPLDGYVHDSRVTGDAAVAATALPFGATREIDGVPFQFVERGNTTAAADHLDVGRSLFRQGNLEGYESTEGPLLGGAFAVDPARIQLEIPNDAFDALHLIAAADGDAGSVPLVAASFFRPKAGFHEIFSARVPGLTDASGAGATAVPVTLDDGRKAKLWHVTMPLDPGRLAAFADLDAVALELSKEMRQYRGYPDPIVYGWRPGGPPSGVHVYALTLHRAAVRMEIVPARFGHVWTAPERPGYEVVLANRAAAPRRVTVAMATTSHDGEEVWKDSREVTLAARGETRVRFDIDVKKHGWHAATFTLTDGTTTRVERRSFARLAPDTRAAAWQEGRGPLFGYWGYNGGHHTPPAVDTMRVMRAAGARAVVERPRDPEAAALVDEWRWRVAGSAHAVPAPIRAWGDREPDAAEVAAFQEKVIANVRRHQGDDPEIVSFFAEPQISRDLTTGSPPEWWGDAPAELQPAERQSLTAFMRTAQAAAEAVRKTWPRAQVLIPWGDPLFVLPLLKSGFPRRLIDGSALDMIGFERLPEQQIHQMSTHRLFFLREAYRAFGLPDPQLAYVEGVFVPTEPGACTWDEQAERYHRWALLSMAYGIKRFYSGWFAYDCGDWYGAEHYGGCGIQRRIPFCDPKPAYAHFATLTRLLDGAAFDRWIPTGSHSVYCLRFTRPAGGPMLVIWTLRGRRPVRLHAAAARATVIDAMDNAREVSAADDGIEVVAGTSPVYVTGLAEPPTVSLGAPDHADAVAWSRGRNAATWHGGPGEPHDRSVHEMPLARFGDGSWRIDPARDEAYERNNYDTRRFPAPMTARVVADPGHAGPVLAVHLEPPPVERKTMPWYTRLVPAQPIPIPGKAAALGIHVKAASDWGRVVFCLTDAKGERWLSVGRKDAWTCDDPHSWSSFCFDGWRYLRFEMPSHAEYDCFREVGTTWWGNLGGDRVVDLPLRLDAVVVERRTHVMYVNDPQPADPADVLLGDLVAEYAAAADATEAAVTASRVRMPMPRGAGPVANPITRMRETPGGLPAPTLEKVTMPDWGYDGTRCHVHFTEAAVPATYQVWVAAYPDGRGAVALGTLKASGGLLGGLRPAMKLYLWVTATENLSPEARKAKQVPRTSPPSNMLEIELVDEFGMK